MKRQVSLLSMLMFVTAIACGSSLYLSVRKSSPVAVLTSRSHTVGMGEQKWFLVATISRQRRPVVFERRVDAGPWVQIGRVLSAGKLRSLIVVVDKIPSQVNPRAWKFVVTDWGAGDTVFERDLINSSSGSYGDLAGHLKKGRPFMRVEGESDTGRHSIEYRVRFN